VRKLRTHAKRMLWELILVLATIGAMVLVGLTGAP
jgi:hypothetical protein